MGKGEEMSGWEVQEVRGNEVRKSRTSNVK